MTVIVKSRNLTIPETIAKEAGIKPGDLVEFKASRGTITVTSARLDETRFPLYTPTKAEAASIRKGRAAYKRGDHVTLKQLQDELDSARRKARNKITRKAS